ncbi:MAG TPA: hypothetical protein PKL54_12950 [Candidatus Hydrogenedentes bacterium]|nr:hypothetical protein [Candidatus Hydrogenedentota bacterium]
MVELLSPYAAFFAGRGLRLPAPGNGGAVDYETLARIFMTPDRDTPKQLAEALYHIHDMSTPEGMDKLQEAAERKGLDLGLNGDAHPAAVAVRLWVRDSRLFEEVHAEYHLARPKSFLTFLSERRPVPAFAPPTAETRAAMEARMDLWFDKKRRGRGCRVLVYPRGPECWFMVRHGKPWQREGTHEPQGESGSVFYQPQQHDVLVYDIEHGEIRIHAGSKGERELYRKVFGAHLFGDENFFPGDGKYRLTPLLRDGAKSMNCLDVEGIEWVRVREIEMLCGHGIGAEREIRKGPDLFASFEARGFRLTAEMNLQRAVFSVKFADSKTARSVTIHPTNHAKYERDDDGGLLEAWLAKRGFIIEEPDEDEAGEAVEGS